MHLLLVANHKDGQWRGIPIKRGQRLTSLSKLAAETNLSIKNIRTAIKRLKSTNEVASQSSAQSTMFTVVNYDLYQGEASETAHQVANEGQAMGKQGATNNNDKNEKKEKKIIINDAFSYFWLNMKLKKAAKPKAELAFNKHAEQADDEMEFAKMLVEDTKERSLLNQFGFDKLNPTTYLNQNRWEDDKPVNESEKYKYVLDQFNEEMKNCNVPFAESMTGQRVNMIKHLFATTDLNKENIGDYFGFMATNKAFDWSRGETGSDPKGMSYFLSEEAYYKARES
jgi:hypothetical protein